MILFLLIAAIIIVPITLISYFKSKQIQNTNAVKDVTVKPQDRLAVLFFEECRKRGITSLSEPSSINTALEILNYNVNFKNLPHNITTAQNLFYQGKRAIDEINQKKAYYENERKRKEQEKEFYRRNLLD